MRKEKMWFGLVCLVMGLSVSVSSAVGSWYLVDDFSGSSVDTNQWIVTTEGGASATVDNGRLMCYSPNVETYPFSSCTVDLNVGTGRYFSLDDVGGTFGVAYDWELSADSERAYRNGMMMLTDTASLLYAVVAYGVTEAAYFGSPSVAGSLYSSDPIWKGREMHVEFVVSTTSTQLQVFNVDPNATGPDSYVATGTANPNSTQPGALLVDLSIGSAISSVNDLFCFEFSGSESKDVGISRNYYDNVYATFQVPEPASLMLLVAGGLLLRKRR